MEQATTPMEYKPVFMPRVGSDNLVKTDMVRIERHVGFATRQKMTPAVKSVHLNLGDFNQAA